MRNTWIAALRRTTAFAALAAGLLLAGCENPGTATEDEYELRTVNDRPLPAAYPDPLMPAGQFRVTAGTLVLEDEGRLVGTFTVGCEPDLPPGSTCTVEEPRQEFQGTYSREEGWMEFGGRRYPAEFTSGAVSVRIFVPSYLGYYPEYNLRFTR
jgi:hypothetical protein